MLAVDDDASMRELIRLHLENAGHRVVLAEDAVSAGHEVMRRKPDVIVCDIDMPYMSGLDFLSALKADPEHRAIPVILLSAHEPSDLRGQAIEAAACLRKPITSDRLLAAIRQAGS